MGNYFAFPIELLWLCFVSVEQINNSFLFMFLGDLEEELRSNMVLRYVLILLILIILHGRRSWDPG